MVGGQSNGFGGSSQVCLPSRSPSELLAVIENTRLETNKRYMAADNLTFCNLAVHDITSALGCPVPFILANAQVDWLRGTDGQAAGWNSATADEAWAAAQLGCPALAMWKNGTGGHGHAAVLTITPADGDHRIYIAQAGKENFSCRPIERGFGLNLTPEFFVHD